MTYHAMAGNWRPNPGDHCSSLRSLRSYAQCGLLLLVMSLCTMSPVFGEDERSQKTHREEQEVPMSPEATEFVRGMALVLLPNTYTDDDDWGLQKRIQSGLNVDLDGLQLRTSRRWKEVNHGVWHRVDATLVSPNEFFRLSIILLPRTESGDPRYRVHVSVRLRATIRQQQWTLGAKLYSISAELLADLDFEADVCLKNEISDSAEDTRLRVLPYVETAQTRLTGFSLRRVSHAKGGPVREFGHSLDSILKRAVKKKGAKLADKINRKVQKKPERFEVPAPILAIFGQSAKKAPELTIPATSE